MKRSVVALAVLFALLPAILALRAADKPDSPAVTEKNYVVFRKDGSAANLDDLIAAARAVNVTFLGEFHDDPVAHYLELEILKRLASGKTALSLEMFERDTQPVLNEYLAGLIPERYLLSDARPWKNYKTDYRPLIEFAKEQKLPVVAANAPSRWVNRVSRLGPDSLAVLDEEARKSLAPIPYAEASRAYAEQFKRVMSEMEKESSQPGKKGAASKKGRKTEPPQPSTHPEAKWALQAQGLWDATMAYSIASTLDRTPEVRILQINGAFHSQHRLGILDHLPHYRPNITTLVVTMESAKTFPHWDPQRRDAGDFVILTDPSLPRSSPETTSGKKETPKSQKRTDK